MRRVLVLALVALGVAGATATALVNTPEECSGRECPAMKANVQMHAGHAMMKMHDGAKGHACPHSCTMSQCSH
jgi:hypothetical protein